MARQGHTAKCQWSNPDLPETTDHTLSSILCCLSAIMVMKRDKCRPGENSEPMVWNWKSSVEAEFGEICKLIALKELVQMSRRLHVAKSSSLGPWFTLLPTRAGCFSPWKHLFSCLSWPHRLPGHHTPCFLSHITVLLCIQNSPLLELKTLEYFRAQPLALPLLCIYSPCLLSLS